MTAADEALTLLRRRILSGSLVAGTKLQQEQLAVELGMSRIPVRDAIRTLASEGLVSLQPHRTAVVTPVSL
ncbi:MAG: GntR family transcriptional regulator, partial [Acidimicrobiia bacterium]|nr:GntR family transcriptional regulator [Acidimicrobiia bacterium]